MKCSSMDLITVNARRECLEVSEAPVTTTVRSTSEEIEGSGEDTEDGEGDGGLGPTQSTPMDAFNRSTKATRPSVASPVPTVCKTNLWGNKECYPSTESPSTTTLRSTSSTLTQTTRPTITSTVKEPKPEATTHSQPTSHTTTTTKTTETTTPSLEVTNTPENCTEKRRWGLWGEVVGYDCFDENGISIFIPIEEASDRQRRSSTTIIIPISGPEGPTSTDQEDPPCTTDIWGASRCGQTTQIIDTSTQSRYSRTTTQHVVGGPTQPCPTNTWGKRDCSLRISTTRFIRPTTIARKASTTTATSTGAAGNPPCSTNVWGHKLCLESTQTTVQSTTTIGITISEGIKPPCPTNVWGKEECPDEDPDYDDDIIESVELHDGSTTPSDEGPTSPCPTNIWGNRKCPTTTVSSTQMTESKATTTSPRILVTTTSPDSTETPTPPCPTNIWGKQDCPNLLQSTRIITMGAATRASTVAGVTPPCPTNIWGERDCPPAFFATDATPSAKQSSPCTTNMWRNTKCPDEEVKGTATQSETTTKSTITTTTQAPPTTTGQTKTRITPSTTTTGESPPCPTDIWGNSKCAVNMGSSAEPKTHFWGTPIYKRRRRQIDQPAATTAPIVHYSESKYWKQPAAQPGNSIRMFDAVAANSEIDIPLDSSSMADGDIFFDDLQAEFLSYTNARKATKLEETSNRQLEHARTKRSLKDIFGDPMKNDLEVCIVAHTPRCINTRMELDSGKCIRKKQFLDSQTAFSSNNYLCSSC